ncbi:MAG: hypothetical protein PUG55_03330, partial [Bacillales bacterium]|nr:hypothetical protein [Bacillales bacterium]
MSGKLLLITKSVFIDSELYKSVDDYIFNQGKFDFGQSITLAKIEEYFGNRKEAVDDFYQFEPEIERLYFDFDKGEIRSIVASFYNLDDRIQYGLIAHIPVKHKYELVYICSNIDRINTAENDSRSLNQNIANKIIKYVADKDLSHLTSLSSNLYFSSIEGLYYVDESKCSPELKEILQTILYEKVDAVRSSDVKLASLVVDVDNLDNPIFMKVEFGYKEKKYEYWFDTNELIELSEFDHGDSAASYRNVFFEMAEKEFIDANGYIIKDNLLKRNKEKAKSFFSTLYKKFTLKEYEDGTYGFEELGEPSFIAFKDNCVELRTNRNVDNKERVSFDYPNLNENKNSVKKIIDRYILTKTKEFDNFINDVQDFLNNSYDLETAKEKGKSLLERVSSFPAYDRATSSFDTLVSKIKEKYEKLLHLDKE